MISLFRRTKVCDSSMLAKALHHPAPCEYWQRSTSGRPTGYLRVHCLRLDSSALMQAGQVNEVVWNGQSDAILMAAGRQSATYTEKGVVVLPPSRNLLPVARPCAMAPDMAHGRWRERHTRHPRRSPRPAGRGASWRRRHGAQVAGRRHGAHGQLHVHRPARPHQVRPRPARDRRAAAGLLDSLHSLTRPEAWPTRRKGRRWAPGRMRSVRRGGAR